MKRKMAGIAGALLMSGTALIGTASAAEAVNCSSSTDRYGNTYGSCSNGESWSSSTDRYGNTYGNSSKGGSWSSTTDRYGNTYGSGSNSFWN